MKDADITTGRRIQNVHWRDQIYTVEYVDGEGDKAQVIIRMDGPAVSARLVRELATIRDHFEVIP